MIAEEGEEKIRSRISSPGVVTQSHLVDRI